MAKMNNIEWSAPNNTPTTQHARVILLYFDQYVANIAVVNDLWREYVHARNCTGAPPQPVRRAPSGMGLCWKRA